MARDRVLVKLFLASQCRPAGQGQVRGPGSWAFIVKHQSGRTVSVAGFESSSTESRLQLTAAVKSLEYLRSHFYEDRMPRVELHGHTRYIVEGLSTWLDSWKAKGWQSASNRPVMHKDLWQRLDELRQGLRLKAIQDVDDSAMALALEALQTKQGIAQREFSPSVAAQAAADQWPTPAAKRAGPIEFDLSLSDEEMGRQLRTALLVARGRIVRCRER